MTISKQNDIIDQLNNVVLSQNKKIDEQNTKLLEVAIRSEVLSENQNQVIDSSSTVIDFLSILITFIGIIVPVATYYFGYLQPRKEFERFEKVQSDLLKELRATQSQVLRTHYDTTKGIYRVSTGIRYCYHIFKYDETKMNEITIANVLDNVLKILTAFNSPVEIKDLRNYAPLPEVRTYLYEMSASPKPQINTKAAMVEEKIKEL